MSAAQDRTSICRYRTGTIPIPAWAPCRTAGPTSSMSIRAIPNTLLPLGTVRRLESWTNSNYHALQLRAEKRYSRGLTFNASFNFQKAMYIGYGVNEGGPYGNSYTQDPRDRLADYGRSQIDQRFRFVFSHIWEIPWLRKAKGPKGWILGGWAINGIVQLTSGLAGHGAAERRFAEYRAFLVPASARRLRADRWIAFGTTAASISGSIQAAFVRSKCDGCAGEGVYLGPKGYGNAGVSLFDAPAQKTWDFACFKEFAVQEGHRIQFRYEAFNFLNTPQFAAPSRSLGAADFGRISSTVINNREMQLGLKYLF